MTDAFIRRTLTFATDTHPIYPERGPNSNDRIFPVSRICFVYVYFLKFTEIGYNAAHRVSLCSDYTF